jgi:small GTP-binding protein
MLSYGIGKSSLTVQFVENHFVESYYPTIENTFSKTIKYKGQEFATEIIDTAGQVYILSHFPSEATILASFLDGKACDDDTNRSV